jgi:acetyl-CoA C-acetyltransferase
VSAFSVGDRRTPVIVGVGQHVHRPDEPAPTSPVELMGEAVRAAAADAGLAGVPSSVDSVRVVSLLSYRAGNPAWLLAEQLGISAREHAYTTVGGNTPQSLVNRTALDIAGGRVDLVVLTGSEAWRTRMQARKAGSRHTWPVAPDDHPPVIIGEELEMTHQAETAKGVYLPVQVYPMFDTAIRASMGRTPDEQVATIAELWSRFSQVAAGNPYAWLREPRSPEDIATVTPRNRIIGLPYRKVMNSNNDVDMGAALIMCSVERADALGIARDRWVFPQSGTDCHEHNFVSNRWTFSDTPAIRLGGQRALELAGVGIDDIAIVDLYSCFPSAVQLGAASLGLDALITGGDRQLTRTGGMAFAGGPWNNYVMHSIATVVAELRESPGERGLVWGNGGYVTKHAFGVYGTEPPPEGFRFEYPQDEIDALPHRAVAEGDDATGRAEIEAYTVMFDRDGNAELAIATCLLDDGRRAWATSDHVDVTAALLEGEWVGRRVVLGDGGELRV